MLVAARQVSAQELDPIERAIQSAAEKCAPFLVRIETLGGFEKVGNVLVGTGPTTGLVVGPQGYVISSAFNFAQKPAQILIYLGDGSRHPAKLIATDHNHQLVLLKIEIDRELPIPTPAPLDKVAVGQTAIALGRAFEGDKPNLSVGIISAVNRIWGKAFQTDAKISPNNYGGALVDLNGRVLGVLAPLSLMPGGGEDAGVEWYDSGIGFAVPLETINRVLPRLQKGEDLHPGLMGISLKGSDIYADPAAIAAVQPNSPAAKAELKPGDVITQIEGTPITRQAQLKHALGPRFAGDIIKIKVKRGKDELEKELKLVAKLAAYQHPFLGILPQREPEPEMGKEPPKGVTLRAVYPESAAAKAGLLPGDRLIAIDDKELASRAALQDYLNTLNIGVSVNVKFQRGGKEQTAAAAKLDKLPENIPPDLPPAHGPIASPSGDPPRTGLITFKLPEFPNECVSLIPDSYQTNVPHGIVIWLHAPGGTKTDELTAQWKDLCAKHDLILVAPKSGDITRWQRSETDFIRKACDDVISKYNIDRTRVVVAGQDGGAALAAFVAFQHRDLIRGLAMVNAPLPNGANPPANDPVYRLAFFLAGPSEGPTVIKYQAAVKKLRDLFYPVSVLGQGAAGRPLEEKERAELIRWIDCLDRL